MDVAEFIRCGVVTGLRQLLEVSIRLLLCCAVLCCAVLCCAVLCCAVLCCAVPWAMCCWLLIPSLDMLSRWPNSCMLTALSFAIAFSVFVLVLADALMLSNSDAIGSVG